MTLGRFWGITPIVFGRVKLLKLLFYTPKKNQKLQCIRGF